MPTTFADGCVFQQGKAINVFGYSEENGSTVRVTLGDDVGEGNCSTNTGYYTRCLDGLRSVMGRVFGGDDELPMFIVQLSTYGDRPMGFEILSNGTWYAAEGQVDGSVLTLYASGAFAPSSAGAYWLCRSETERYTLRTDLTYDEFLALIS